MTTQNPVRPSLITVAQAPTFLDAQGKPREFGILNEGVIVGYTAKQLLKKIQKDVVRSEATFRNGDPRKIDDRGRRIDRSVNAALREYSSAWTDKDGVTHDEVIGLGAGVLTTYKDGTQIYASLADLVAVLAEGFQKVSRVAPVLRKGEEKRAEFANLPYNEDIGAASDAAMFFAIGVNRLLNLDADVTEYLVSPAFGRQIATTASHIVSKAKRDGLILSVARTDADEAEGYRANGWQQERVVTLQSDIPAYTPELLLWEAGIFVGFQVGDVSGARGTVKWNGFVGVRALGQAVFGVEVVGKAPGRRQIADNRPVNALANAARVRPTA